MIGDNIISNMLYIILAISTTINGTGNGDLYMTNNTTNITENLTGIIEMETNHIIEGIPDAPPTLEPRFPMPFPSM